MVDLAMLQVVRDLVAIFGVIAGFTYYVLTVRNSQRMQKMTLETRQAQLFMQIYNRWNDESFIKRNDDFSSYEFTNMDDFIEKYGREGLVTGRVIGRYYEGIGVLVKRGLIDVTMVMIYCQER